jgi:hypothetical protein
MKKKKHFINYHIYILIIYIYCDIYKYFNYLKKKINICQFIYFKLIVLYKKNIIFLFIYIKLHYNFILNFFLHHI